MAYFQKQDSSQAQIYYEVIPGVLPQDTLFIHGNLASHRWWYPTEEAIKKQNKGKTLQGAMILADFRGCGQSSAPRSQADIDMHLFAQDFVDLTKSLRQQNLIQGPINLVGHSTGGLICALMMAQTADLFKKAVLLDPVGARGVKFDSSMLGAFEQMKSNKEIVSAVMDSTIYQNNKSSDFFRQIVVEDAFHAVKTVGAGVLQALDGLNVQEECRKIGHPVLVLHGEHDVLLPMADSKDLASLMPNGAFEVLAGCGHCANAEKPDIFAETLQKFFWS